VKNKIVSRLALSIGALSIATYACSSGDTGEVAELTGGTLGSGGSTGGALPTAASGGTGTGGAGAGGASAATGGAGAVMGTGGGIIVTTGGSSSGGMEPITEDMACGTGMASANLKPVNMFIVFDRSYSMLECGSGDGGGMLGMMGGGCDTGPTRWALASTALTQFFQDPGADALGVALRFYPHGLPVEGCTSELAGNPALDGGKTMGCDIAACATPLVDMAVLTADAAPMDAHEAALVNAVMTSAPVESGEGTPTYVALAGAAQWSVAYQQAHPEQQTVIVLVTDGEPNGCNTDTPAIAQLAADAYTAAQVRTYAIGLTGVGEQFMNAIATAGATDQAFFVNDGATATADLLAAFNAIRGMALACDFPLPSSTSSGMAIDPSLINVNFTTTAGGETELGLVAGAAECGTAEAWYYDDPMMPTRIMLCPAACASVADDANASIAILAGCKPRIPVTK
jgi:hypothetical protein